MSEEVPIDVAQTNDQPSEDAADDVSEERNRGQEERISPERAWKDLTTLSLK